MIKYTTITKKEKTVSSVKCDVCQDVYVYGLNNFKDDMELQEFSHINLLGGYGSVFGDGSTIKCDICQNCLKTLLGVYLRIDEDE